ncbi:hamartin-like isoform X1 [Amphibalanus amphitrite]|uniref:hamartin-like isoform X1 n=1 Tax=Amphibalanus amphitrite TaxID=1232801 RepID=UPI001C913533|nr:hamartin-like isoform X1 [Amphibalanus amphitrite]XP_043230032.1 hamartin-like isoform X1 [Amphibalanus amphitrite]XP_043230033.1 hamartin-like isoform X1 [Amphibalanus amphitrite]XP_043230034.1 hamartin-like isoform X1 [Amphibalanus amphitrite]
MSVGGGGGVRPPSPAEPLDDPGLMFRRLEQADTDEAGHIKELFRENLRGPTGEAWLLNGLIDYYVSTGSARCLEILLTCGDGNSRALIERLHQLLKSPEQRGAGLRLLGYYVRKHPVWLRKIVTQPSPSIVKDLFRIIKSECEVQCIISAALILVILMPMFPVALVDFIQDLFQVLSRLTQMVSSPSTHLSQTHQLHLHVATYSYFVRVYAMYPCNLLSYLRQHYGQRDSLPVFNRTIRPLLQHVRMHPLLVTGSNSTETSPHRWQRKETHDIVAECSHFSLDILEASAMDNVSGPLWSLSAHDEADALGPTDVGLGDQEVLGIHDILCSPATFAARSAAGEAEGGTGCETAVEATPESTPAPTPTVTPQRDLENPPLLRPTSASVQASHALAALVGPKQTTPTTTDSTPTSPQKKPAAPFRFIESDHSQQQQQQHPFSGRLGQVLTERADSGGGAAGGGGQQERAALVEEAAAPAPLPSVSGLRDRRTSGKLSPIKLKLAPVVSPVQFAEGPPPVTRPVPRTSGTSGSSSASGGAPWRGPGTPSRPATGDWSDCAADHSAEDREVSDLTRLQPPTAATSGNLTPFASTTAQLTQAHPLRLPVTAAAAIPCRSATGDREEEDSPPPVLAASLPQSRLDFDLVRHMTRYYSQHVLPSRQHRRTSSCPDVAALTEPAPAPAVTPARQPPTRRSDTGCQTEDTHHPSAYEHLLTVALPPPPAVPHQQVTLSPHQLLREHVSQTMPNARLMHELLLYERYKREVHAHRNRRLFDRTRATRRLEEENRELKRQVEVMSVDVAECNRQLQLVKRQAVRAGEEHRAAALRLEHRAAEECRLREQLEARLEEQRRASDQLAAQLRQQDEQLQQARCQLLDTERQLAYSQEKALRKSELEARVLELERRLLMVGQLRQPVSGVAPSAADPAAGGDPWAQLEPPPPPPDEEGRRRAEAVASGLEQQLRDRELTISELRRLMEAMRVRHHEQIQAMDERYQAVKQHLQMAETRLLRVSEPGGQRSNGAELPAPTGKAARADPGTWDLRDAI